MNKQQASPQQHCNNNDDDNKAHHVVQDEEGDWDNIPLNENSDNQEQMEDMYKEPAKQDFSI